jgi:hypothetical protein
LQGRLDNLFFAGEATDEEYWGYTQGGYRTGLKQAKLILDCLNEKDCQKYEAEDGDICSAVRSPGNIASSYACFILLVVYIIFIFV